MRISADCNKLFKTLSSRQHLRNITVCDNLDIRAIEFKSYSKTSSTTKSQGTIILFRYLEFSAIESFHHREVLLCCNLEFDVFKLKMDCD